MSDLIELSELRVRRERWIDAPPQTVYDLISDVEASAAWTPDLVSATYETEGVPRVGAWFTAVNADVRHEREWVTRSRVHAAEAGRAFAWYVVIQGVDATLWHYRLRPQDGGTLVTESWQVEHLFPVMGRSREELLDLKAHNTAGMEATLDALAEVAAGRGR
ncbi:SRPBCC family protein [Streptomyces sp. NPDC005435]|uniref:SRPBCC family protein n=1 Tax=Streptomyces sp. NPDC005435 TaxID=3154464 RepID=UPI0034529CD0